VAFFIFLWSPEALTIVGLSAPEKVPLVEKRGRGRERGVRKCKHGFKLQFSTSVYIKNVEGL
jgi:hypothetical protein